jgi:hypothetical protein
VVAAAKIFDFDVPRVVVPAVVAAAAAPGTLAPRPPSSIP